MNDDFKIDLEDFLNGETSPPEKLKQRVNKDIFFSLNKNSIIIKFLAFQVLGALITLSFCPQFGIGFVDGHGISHYFRLIGDWACAAFCGTLFLSTGTILASVGMKSDEVYWIWKRYKFPLIILPTSFWMMLMLINISFDLPSETISYRIIWLTFAIFIQQLLLKIKEFTYHGVLKPS